MDNQGAKPPGFRYQEWLLQVDNDLDSTLAPERPSSEEITAPQIFRVPHQIREVSKDSFHPTFLSFGLYNLERRKDSVLDAYRKNFARLFMKITGKGWKEICSEVVGKTPEEVESWVKLYDGVTVNSISEGLRLVKDRATTSTADPRSATIDFIKISLTLDAIFIVCFTQAYHQRTCHTKCYGTFPDLDEEIAKKALKSLVHLIMLDIFKFENQIPLGLIKKVVTLMYCNRKAENNNPHHINEGRTEKQIDPFQKLVVDAVYLVYHLPGPRSWEECASSLKSLSIEKCSHLLHCLYSVVCHNPNDRNRSGGAERAHPAATRESVPSSTSHQGGSASESVPSSTSHRGAAREPVPSSTSHRGAAREPVPSSTSHRGAASESVPSSTSHRGAASESVPSSTSHRRAASDSRLNLRRSAPFSALARPEPPAVSMSLNLIPAGRQEIERLADGPSSSETQLGTRTSGRHRNDASGRGYATQLTHRTNGRPQTDAGGGGHTVQKALARPKKKGQQHHDHKLHVPTVTKLKESGIRVTVGRGKSVVKWISEVKFESSILKGRLYLPPFSVYDETESLLRNLLTYEYVVENQTNLLSFVHLMDNLIDTEEDVKMMKDCGVLKNNSLGSDERLAKVWNTLLTGVVLNISKDYRVHVFDTIWPHYRSKWRKLAEEFMTIHVRKPWEFVIGIIGLVIFLATVIATVYTVLTYYEGSKQRATT